ncbi:hypothetical protein TNCV_1783481 [Trichonephila clavipes]|nr:hypothetical protein TNCV_1783481 [Trichonephila clavipes]
MYLTTRGVTPKKRAILTNHLLLPLIKVGLSGIQVGQFRVILRGVGSDGVNGVCNTTMHDRKLSQFHLDHLQTFTVGQGRSRRARGYQRGRVGKFHIRLVFHIYIRLGEKWSVRQEKGVKKAVLNTAQVNNSRRPIL